MQNAFGSLLTAMVTPFDRQQRVNHEQVAKLAKQTGVPMAWLLQVQQGNHPLFQMKKNCEFMILL